MEEQLDENEEQLMEDEEHNQPTVEQEEHNQPTVEQEGHKDQQIPKNWYQKNHPTDQVIGDKDARIGNRRRQSGRKEKVHFSLLSTIEPGNF